MQLRPASLAYLGVYSPNVNEWRTFAPSILGFEEQPDGPLASASFRWDDRHHRLTIHDGPSNRLAYLGWEYVTQSLWGEAIEALRHRGYIVDVRTDLADTRHVLGLAQVADTTGTTHELTYGQRHAGPFVPGRPLLGGGFVAGSLGLGNVQLVVDNLDGATEFYTNDLGLTITDEVRVRTRTVFLGTNDRHHSLGLAGVPGADGLHHLAVEVRSLDDVGTAFDLCGSHKVPVTLSLGKNVGDGITSFHLRTPAGFDIAYGWGSAVEAGNRPWPHLVHDRMSVWGHQPDPDVPAISTIVRAQ